MSKNSKWSNAWNNIYGTPGTPKIATNTESADEQYRDRYLYALNSAAPSQWMSDHLRQEERLRGAVYVAISVLANQAASAEVHFHRWAADAKLAADKDAREPLERDHDLVRLIHRPNEHDSFGLLMRRMVQQICLTGMSLLWKVSDGFDKPIQMWSIPTGTYQPVAISAQYPNGAYRIMPYFPGPLAQIPSMYYAGGVTVDAKNIIRTLLPHPLVQQEGYSPLQACDLSLDTIESIDRARFSKIRRGIYPSNVLELDPSVKAADEKERYQIQQQLRQVLGGPDKAGLTAVLGPGQKLSPYGADSIEIGYIDSWNQLTSFVLSVFGVTKSLSFMSEEMSYAALYASLNQFNLFTLTPLLGIISESFNHQLIHPYFGEDVHITFVPKAVQDDQLDEQKLANDLRCGARTINEIRVMRGLEKVTEPYGNERAWSSGKDSVAVSEEGHNPDATEESQVAKDRPDHQSARGSLPNWSLIPQRGKTMPITAFAK